MSAGLRCARRWVGCTCSCLSDPHSIAPILQKGSQGSQVSVTCLQWCTWEVAGLARDPPIPLDFDTVLLLRYPSFSANLIKLICLNFINHTHEMKTRSAPLPLTPSRILHPVGSADAVKHLAIPCSHLQPRGLCHLCHRSSPHCQVLYVQERHSEASSFIGGRLEAQGPGQSR